MKKIIALCGPENSGKTTTLNMLIELLGEPDKAEKYAKTDKDRMYLIEDYKKKTIAITTSGDDKNAIILNIIFSIFNNCDILITPINKIIYVEDLVELMRSEEKRVMLNDVKIISQKRKGSNYYKLLLNLKNIIEGTDIEELRDKNIDEKIEWLNKKIEEIEKSVFHIKDGNNCFNKFICKDVREEKQKLTFGIVNQIQAEDLLNCIDATIKELNQNP